MLTCLAAASLLCPRESVSQARLEIPAAPSCGACKIVLTRVTTLGDDSEGIVGATYNVARDSRYYYVAHSYEPWLIRVFDLSGRFVRTIGRRGSGPGEFQTIRALRTGPGDTLHVFDRDNRAHTVFASDFRVVRTNRLPGDILDNGVLLLDRQALLLNGVVPTSASAGFPLHLVDSNGRVTTSFGDDNPAVALGASRLEKMRSITPAGNDQVWAASHLTYTIERWQADGKRLQTLHRAAPWFEESHSQSRDRGPGRPPAGLLDIQQDGSGRLWVLGRAPDPNWRSAVRDDRVESMEDYADLVIEVLDPQRARLIASRRLPSFAGAFLDANHLFTYRETDSGHGRIDVWRVHLTTPRRSQ